MIIYTIDDDVYLIGISFDGDSRLIDSCPFIINFLAVHNFEESK